MKLSNQVTSLEWSRKLKQLGVPQRSLWSWVKEDGKWSLEWTTNLSKGSSKFKSKVSAFTVAELGEMLPNDFVSGKDGGSGKFCCWSESNIIRVEHIESDNTEANARASMLCYLLEHKLIDIKSLTKE